jgi:DNA-binding IclR family transcriptional regulator
MPPADYQVQSLTRAVSLLRAFTPEEASLTLGDLSRRTGLPRSTVHRLVVNLVQLGLLSRDPVGERYRPGLLLARLGNLALSRHQIRDVARPIMERLVHASGESSQLAALDGSVAVYIERVESDRHKLTLTHRLGDQVPLHSAGTGKCLLAFTDPAQVSRLLPCGPLPAYTVRTITDPKALLAHLADIRARGYSVDSGECEPGLTSIAAPVWDAANDLVASLCVAGPSERILAGRRDELTTLVRTAADDISIALGADLTSRRPAAASTSTKEKAG